METKTKVSEYKGHPILSIEGVGQKGKEYNIMGAGAAKWASVVKHIKEIKAFVKESEKLRALADKTKEAEKTAKPTAKADKVVF